MKKLIAIVLAVMLAVSCSIAVSAANATPNTTTLTTTVPDAEYTLNIPADQEIPFGAISTEIGSISVTDSSSFAVGKNLEVTLTYDDFTCEDVTTTIPFTVKLNATNPSNLGDATVESGGKLVFQGRSNGEVYEYATKKYIDSEGQMDITKISVNSADWGKALGGDYTATITFSAEVVAAE